ncbi:hypothetical protein BLA29_007059 [Euroglyphus maynei]|uniref:SAYSvFN domain-containing protein n=1 Tax=Euroglyphus maynei TaxID=6958 RepID=A0A1Y3API6_EURMA|nr:hypothetical protein BLA29_007059 [Euroglyphus maynei]
MTTDTDNNENNNLSPKERLAMFQASMKKLETETEIKTVRQLLHERYLQRKALNQSTSDTGGEKLPNECKDVKKSVKMGRQMARVFRFETGNNLRNRQNPRQQQAREHELDPLLNDPNVLFENFAFDNDDFIDWNDDNEHRPDLPFFPDQQTQNDDEEDDNDDDSFRSLILSPFRRITWHQWSFWTICLTLYVYGQWQANRLGFGAPFLIIAALLFIVINLRHKAPGELSAYSVFNPNCRPIPSVASHEQPREQILLGFGPL